MFFSELTPILKELMGQPITFTGGLVSGILRLNPNEDPLKSWLSQEEGNPSPSTQKNTPPQTIKID